MRSRCWTVLGVLALAFLDASSLEALTLLPLEIEDAALLPRGTLELAVGAAGLTDTRGSFRSEERDEWRGPAASLRAGLGDRAEVAVHYSMVHASDAISINPPLPDPNAEGGIVIDPTTPRENRGSESGSGDAVLATKVRVFSTGDFDRAWIPDAAILFGVKFPNANDRLGTDETDLFARGLLARSFGGLRVFSDLGIAVLGNPGIVGGQDDVLLWGGGVAMPALVEIGPSRWTPLVEVSGVSGSRFDNGREQIRAGLRVRWEDAALYAGGRFGLGDRADEVGGSFGVVWWFEAFTPAPSE